MDEGLREFDLAFDDVDEVEHHPSLGTHHKVEIAQADIEVDDHDLLTALGECCTQRCCRGRLADSTLPRGHHKHSALSRFRLCLVRLWPWLLHRWHFSRETVRRHGTHAGTSEVERREYGIRRKEQISKDCAPRKPAHSATRVVIRWLTDGGKGSEQ